ncbi:MAG: elongation factor EF-2, partial [Nanoarchaeota archaeon]|nr:elongation factor EF-2 [Nanoarchaeota archaeon]
KEGGEGYKEIRKKAPLHEVVLNAVIKHHPDPVQAQEYRIPKLWHGDLDSEEGKSLIKCDPKGPLFFVITKVVVDPQAGEISAGRMFSGTMTRSTDVILNRAKKRMKVQQVFIYNGAKREIVNNVPSGNIIGISGVKAMPGETITLSETEPFEEITHLFDPVVTKSIEAKSPSDLPKLIEVLRMVQKEDPTIKVEINEETGEHLMHGMGELHLEVIENRIRTEKGVEVSTSPPIVVYRETVTKRTPDHFEGKSPNKHNKLYFIIEPIDPQTKALLKSGDVQEGRIKKKDLILRDKFIAAGWDTKDADKIKDIFNGNLFVDQTRGIVYINEILELVLDMFEDVMKAGPLAREPCVGVRVNLTDCKLHEDAIHRGPAQMYPAVREGIRGAMALSNPLIFEPVQTLQFEAPVEYMGEISKMIANKRGQLIDMSQEGVEVVVKGKLPVAEMFGMTSDLRSATGGRGNHFLVDQNFEKLPEEMQHRVIKIIRERKGLSENQ